LRTDANDARLLGTLCLDHRRRGLASQHTTLWYFAWCLK
jgi:hypothetical protein